MKTSNITQPHKCVLSQSLLYTATQDRALDKREYLVIIRINFC